MKPGYLTTEFWVVIVYNVLTQIGALSLPGKDRWIASAATIAAYALSRGLAKLTQPATTSVTGVTQVTGK